MKKVRIFDQNHGLTPLENFRFFGHIRYIFLFSRKASFLSRTSPNIISWPIFNKKKTMKKVLIFDQNHGLTRLESIPFFDYIKHIYFLCRTPSFLSKTSPNIIFGPFLNKNTQLRKFKFLSKMMG